MASDHLPICDAVPRYYIPDLGTGCYCSIRRLQQKWWNFYKETYGPSSIASTRRQFLPTARSHLNMLRLKRTLKIPAA